MHSTNNIEDGYIGSGSRLRNSIRAHGKNSHEMKILEFFENREDLSEREKEIVNEEILKDPLCMNLVKGGEAKPLFDMESRSKGAKTTHEKIWKDPEFIKKIKNTGSITFKKLWEENRLSIPDWTGKTHSEETKKKIGTSSSIKQKGERNSQFGTFWINNGEVNKKIKKEDLILYETKGWKRGRI